MQQNIRELMDMVKVMGEKLDHKTSFNETKVRDDKSRMDKIFEKKQIGRPVGSWESKREQYFEMIKLGKIKQPKQDTLDYYQINRNPDDGTYHLSD